MRKFFLILIFSCLLVMPLPAQPDNHGYVSSSVLSSGQWFKLSLNEDGVYKIDFAKLKQIGLTDPGKIRIYGNNQGQLSYYNYDFAPDDLKEIAIYTETGTDGIFNEGDYILFYGKGTNKWKFNSLSNDYEFIRHNFSDTACYFLTSRSEPGKRVEQAPVPAASVSYSSATSDVLYIHEKDVVNILRSGREWYQRISPSSGITINPGFKDLVVTEGIKYKIRVLDAASVPTMFRFYEGQILHQSVQVGAINIYTTTGAKAKIEESEGTFNPSSSSPVFEVRYYNNGEGGEHGWLDYVRLEGRRNNIFNGKIMQFSDYKSIGTRRISEFSLSSTDPATIIWDVTDQCNVKKVTAIRSGDIIKFRDATDSLKTYVAFNPANTLLPAISSAPVLNQDLHSSAPADMIILTHPLFREQASKLAAIHFKNSGMISMVVTPDEVYNEFSGGIRDIAAIRNFIRMKYLKQKQTNQPLKYLLLFGDGSYENRSLPPGNTNYIPTWQSQNSNIIVSSFTSDDFYGLLEEDEGESEGTVDIGIGRFPVSDTTEAGIVLSKISDYLSPSNTGSWKNIITLVADDEDGNAHSTDAEGLAAIIKDSIPSVNINKIYLDAFKQISSSNGQSYPDVTRAISDRINSGSLIVNYTGHGNENGLAAERVIKKEDIDSWVNIAKLPLFITATCEFSRFDNVDLNEASMELTENTSAGELLLLSPKGGAIALMSTTRVVYSAPNYLLNKSIYDFAFDRDADGNGLRMGDIIKLAKNNSGNGSNKRNFSLLGDPALRLAYPWHGKVVTDSVNHVSLNYNADTLRALSIITVSGHVEDKNADLEEDYNGEVYPIVFDKESTSQTLSNDGDPVMEFKQRNNILYSGKTVAQKGRFTFSFIVPRDINYSFGNGKISYYTNNDKTELSGYLNDIIVGGFSNTAANDTSGPQISLFLNDTLFRNGGITDNNPVLLVIIKDKSGINVTGSGIGHDLTANIDNKAYIINNLYENDFNTYRSGKVEYQLNDLLSGNHTVKVKAWDNYNNSSEESVSFIVKSGSGFILNNLINYPNPFNSETKITAEHNRPDEELVIIIRIFNMNGQVIKQIKTSVSSGGYVIPPIFWDGNEDGGKRAGKGIHPYSVTVSTAKGESVTVSGRMIIL